MQPNKGFLVLLVLSVGVVSDSFAADEKFERVSSIPADKAVVYVFRQKKLAGAAMPMGVAINGAPIGAYFSGDYSVERLHPGKLQFTTAQISTLEGWISRGSAYKYFEMLGPSKRWLSMEVEAGKEYFVEIRIGFDLKHHVVDAPPKELLAAKRMDFAVPWHSYAAAEAARKAAEACLKDRRDELQQCLLEIESRRKKP